MTPEHALMSSIMLWCGQHNYLCFRENVGLFYTARKPTKTDDDWIQIGTQNRMSFTKISTGLPEGFSDLLVIKPNGQACFIETKIHPRKPTEAQKKFIKAMQEHGCNAGVAYSLEEAITIIESKK